MPRKKCKKFSGETKRKGNREIWRQDENSRKQKT